jgi:hypothetical protein
VACSRQKSENIYEKRNGSGMKICGYQPRNASMTSEKHREMTKKAENNENESGVAAKKM